VSKLVGQQLMSSLRAVLARSFPGRLVANIFHRLKDLKTSQYGSFLMQVIAWIKLRWRQAFLARYGKCIAMSMLQRHDALERLASLGRRGSPEKLNKRNSQDFPVYFFEGSALGMRVRLLMRYVVMHFCFASISLAKQSQQRALQALLKT
jgi:hypothetical protein